MKIKKIHYMPGIVLLENYMFLILPIFTATLQGGNSIAILYMRKLRSVK